MTSNKLSKTIIHILDFKPKTNRPFDHFLLKVAEQTEAIGYKTRFIFSKEPDAGFIERLPNSTSFIKLSGNPYDAFTSIVTEVKHLKPIVTTLTFLPIFSWKTYLLRSLTPLIWIDQSSEEISEYHGIKKVFAKVRGNLISKLIYKVISASDFNRNRNIQSLFINAKKNIRIHNGCILPTNNKLTTSDKTPYFFFCGMLKKTKGVHTLIKAFDIFCNQEKPITNTELWLAGEDFNDLTISNALKENKHSKRIKVLGHRSDIHKMMVNAIAVIIPSEWPEAFGFTAIEAMYSGRPVIHSDAGALPEVVGSLGTCFAKGNVEQLSNILLSTISPDEKLLLKAQQAKKKVMTDYTIDRMVTDYMQVFRQFLKI